MYSEDQSNGVGKFPVSFRTCPSYVAGIIFDYTFPPYRDLTIKKEMVHFLIYFFGKNLPGNHLRFLENHLIPLFENHERKFHSLGQDYWYLNEHNFQVTYWKEDMKLQEITKEMRQQVYNLNKSRDFFVKKLRKLFPAISYFKDLPLKAGGKSSLSTSHIFT